MVCCCCCCGGGVPTEEKKEAKQEGGPEKRQVAKRNNPNDYKLTPEEVEQKMEVIISKLIEKGAVTHEDILKVLTRIAMEYVAKETGVSMDTLQRGAAVATVGVKIGKELFEKQDLQDLDPELFLEAAEACCAPKQQKMEEMTWQDMIGQICMHTDKKTAIEALIKAAMNLLFKKIGHLVNDAFNLGLTDEQIDQISHKTTNMITDAMKDAMKALFRTTRAYGEKHPERLQVMAKEVKDRGEKELAAADILLDFVDGDKDTWKKEKLAEVLQKYRCKGDDINSTNDEGKTAICSAAEAGHLNAIDCLVEGGADVKKAIPVGNSQVVGVVAGIEFKSGGASPLWMAAACGQSAAVQRLAAARADVNQTNADSIPPLIAAACGGSYAAVECLLKNRADIKKLMPNGANAWTVATAKDYEEIANYLLKSGAQQIRIKGMTGLTAEEVLEKYGCQPKDVHSKNAEGYTAASAAAAAGDVAAIQCLVNARADLNHPNSDDGGPFAFFRPLDAACYHKQDQAVKCLVANRADVNLAIPDRCTRTLQRDSNVGVAGFTAMFWAVDGGNHSAIELLANARANVDHVCAIRYTPLMLAAQLGELQVAQALVRAKADVNYCVTDGANKFCAWGVADFKGHSEVADFLAKSGAKKIPVPRGGRDDDDSDDY